MANKDAIIVSQSFTTIDENGCEAYLEEIIIQNWDDPISQFELSTYNAMRDEILDLFVRLLVLLPHYPQYH